MPALESVNKKENSSVSGANAVSQITSPVHVKKLQRVISDMNSKVKNDTEIIFDYDKASKRVWLNVVDKVTGKVVAEMPPEVIRQIQDGYSRTAGLLIDKRI